MFIEIKNLSKIYNKYLAVNKINFHLEKNKTIGLLGPNGCGKTTTIGMMLGLVTPSNGEILIENKNLNSFRRDEILKRFNFASPYVELPKKLTVRQNLEIYGRLYGLQNLSERINEISGDLDIKSFFTRKTGELSSGQKNRVSLAKSLINKPEILLLDEPFAALDVMTIKTLQEIIVDLQSASNISVILCDHQARDLLACVDTAAIIHNGKVVAQGTPSNLIQNVDAKNAYFGESFKIS